MYPLVVNVQMWRSRDMSHYLQLVKQANGTWVHYNITISSPLTGNGVCNFLKWCSSTVKILPSAFTFTSGPLKKHYVAWYLPQNA